MTFAPGQQVVCVREDWIWSAPTLTEGAVYTVSSCFIFGGLDAVTLVDVEPGDHPQVRFVGYEAAMFRSLEDDDPHTATTTEVAA